MRTRRKTRERRTIDPAGGAGKGMFHYVHPTDEFKMWCGSPRDGGPIPDPSPQSERVDCVVCAGLRQSYGIPGWLALRDGAT